MQTSYSLCNAGVRMLINRWKGVTKLAAGEGVIIRWQNSLPLYFSLSGTRLFSARGALRTHLLYWDRKLLLASAVSNISSNSSIASRSSMQYPALPGRPHWIKLVTIMETAGIRPQSGSFCPEIVIQFGSHTLTAVIVNCRQSSFSCPSYSLFTNRREH